MRSLHLNVHSMHNTEDPVPLSAIPPTKHTSSRNPFSSPLPPPPLPQFSRRQQLALLSSLPSVILTLPSLAASSDISEQELTTLPHLPGIPNYAAPGPLQTIRLPNLEHTCTTCDAPAERCRLKIHAFVPKGGGRLGLNPPYPLAIITPGFLIASDQYTSYCERLASWGFVVISYDRTQAALDPVSDVVCVEFLRDLIDWCRTSVPLGKVSDTNSVYLIGHSRGGKISSLAAAEDTRVKALFLIDPVDVTVYAPLSPEFPSAVKAIESIGSTQKRSLPLAVVGSGRGGDCVPVESNYERFFAASGAPSWEMSIPDAGHLQFLDMRGSTAMDLVCGSGKIPDGTVAEITAAMMVAWGQLMIKRSNSGVSGSESSDEYSGSILNDDANSWRSKEAAGVGMKNKSDVVAAATAAAAAPVIQMGVDDNGRVVAGLASFDSLQALYATETTLREELKKVNSSHGAVLDITSRSKNFEV
jgi:pimeloyl-ACP methyl ester carboxylesterase